MSVAIDVVVGPNLTAHVVALVTMVVVVIIVQQ